MENQIFRIPIKYKELFETMDKCECWKLIIALMNKEIEWLEWLSLTYYNIIIVDIENIENQVKKGQEWGKKWGRPKKDKTPRDINSKTPPFWNQKPKISKDKINKDKISKDNNIVIATEVATLQNYIKENFDLEFITEIYNKYWLSKSDFQEECQTFVNYWTETSLNWKKEKRQKEKTFDPKLRFRTWMKNNKKWNSNLSFKNTGIWEELD
jgi:hypothetical protein